MKVQVIVIDEQDGKFGWQVTGQGKGGHITGEGKRTAKDKKEAEEQAKDFCKMLIKTEQISLETHSVVIEEGIRK